MSARRPGEGENPWDLTDSDEDDAPRMKEIMSSGRNDVDVADGVVETLRLDELIESERYFKLTDWVAISVNSLPVALHDSMGQLGSERHLHYSEFSWYAIQHGVAKLRHDAGLLALQRARTEVRARAMSGGDLEAFARIGRRSEFQFLRAHQIKTTLPCSKQSHARVNEVAQACGIPIGSLGAIAVMKSILTLPNNRGYRALFEEELEAFDRFVKRRTRDLLGR